jgi:hypothetical protein
MYAAMRRRVLLEKHVQGSRRNRPTLYSVREEPRDREEEDQLSKLFPASGSLEFVAMDIFGPLPKMENENHFLLVISDRFSKLTRTVPLRTITALRVAKALCDAWVFSYGPPRYLLTDNGTHFNAKVLLAVCRELGIANIFTTGTKDMPWIFDCTCLAVVCCYVDPLICAFLFLENPLTFLFPRCPLGGAYIGYQVVKELW